MEEGGNGTSEGAISTRPRDRRYRGGQREGKTNNNNASGGTPLEGCGLKAPETKRRIHERLEAPI